MYSTFQRANNIFSLATTYALIFLGLVSIASFLSLPTVDVGSITVKDIIIYKGRLNRWGAKVEELASLRFDVRTDLNVLLNSYNTKQLFLYLTANYEEEPLGIAHDVVLWDRIITREDIRDIRLENVKNKYIWRNPSGTFKNAPRANVTLHYSLMPYVGVLSSGIAATAEGPLDLPDVLKR
nr:signal peptidase [Cryptococcus depauperatus CBS 7855]